MSDAPDDHARDHAARKSVLSADPPRNFTLTVDERIRALTIGVPAFAARKKGIEDFEAKMARVLVDLHDMLVARGSPNDRLERGLLDRAELIDLKRVNSQIATHNRYYPIEANLPMDPRTGDYKIYGHRWLPEEPLSPARLVERAWRIIHAREEDR